MMAPSQQAFRILEQEVQGIRARLDAQLPFALQMPMVAAANVSATAQAAVEQHMHAARHKLRRHIDRFITDLRQTSPSPEMVERAQRRFALLKLFFQTALTHFEIFAEVLTQRSQHGMGVWLAGLDVAAADALRQPGLPPAPPVICYVERGHGAAIRRARTRLPGGGENPVGVIRIPRERMVGTGIASSLFHEVGHQAAAAMDLVNVVKRDLQATFSKGQAMPFAWQAFERWISEIVADLWSVSRVGIAATTGLMSVVSLPSAFVFRVSLNDPHPAPWIRVKLSLAMGNLLYPHPQWARLAAVWAQMYPASLLSPAQRALFTQLDASVPAFAAFLLQRHIPALRGQRLDAALRIPDRHHDQLLALWQQTRKRPQQQLADSPTLAFAVLGQARHEGLLGAVEETRIISALLQRWALSAYLPYAASSPQLDKVESPRLPAFA